MIEDCDAMEPENCYVHGEEARAQNLRNEWEQAVDNTDVEFFGGYHDGPIYTSDEHTMTVGEAIMKAKMAKFMEELLAQAQKPKKDPYKHFRPKNYNKGLGTYVGPAFDKDKLFKFLVVAVCPVPCKGYRVDTEPDWHELCENTAHRAMKELGYE